jgi:hypothetical protein
MIDPVALDKLLADYGLTQNDEWMSELRDDLLALEPQPETTANVDDREALKSILFDSGFFGSGTEWQRNIIADAILAAGFSRAQGDVTVEWGVRDQCEELFPAFTEESARAAKSQLPHHTLVSRTVTAWKEVADE